MWVLSEATRCSFAGVNCCHAIVGGTECSNIVPLLCQSRNVAYPKFGWAGHIVKCLGFIGMAMPRMLQLFWHGLWSVPALTCMLSLASSMSGWTDFQPCLLTHISHLHSEIPKDLCAVTRHGLLIKSVWSHRTLAKRACHGLHLIYCSTPQHRLI